MQERYETQNAAYKAKLAEAGVAPDEGEEVDDVEGASGDEWLIKALHHKALHAQRCSLAAMAFCSVTFSTFRNAVF